PAARFVRKPAGLRGPAGVAIREPIAGPLPDIADHVEEPVAVGWKGSDRRGSGVAIAGEILVREVALPDISHVAAVRRQLLAPGEFGPLATAPLGQFPFALRPPLLSGPGALGFGI